MRTVARFHPKQIRRCYGAIVWWELRRALFNIAVVISGAAFLMVVELIAGRYVESGQHANDPVLVWLGGACFIIATHACYTLGRVIGSIWREGDTSQIDMSVRRRGEMLSLAVAVMPGVVALAAGVVFTFR